MARIRLEETRKNLGYFETPALAALAYNEAAILYHGEFARLNVIPADEWPRGRRCRPRTEPAQS